MNSPLAEPQSLSYTPHLSAPFLWPISGPLHSREHREAKTEERWEGGSIKLSEPLNVISHHVVEFTVGGLGFEHRSDIKEQCDRRYEERIYYIYLLR